MKVFIPIVALLGVVAATPELHAKWSAYKTTHGKDYASHIEPVRLEAFANNVRLIEEHNAKFERGEVSYELGLNEHSDLTHEEFREANMGLVLSPEFRASVNISQHVTQPGASYIDWREKGVVSAVKSQSSCGSCYAFASVGLFESYLLKNNKTETDLSEQDVLDCTYHIFLGDFNNGCVGGDPLFTVMETLKKGLASEDDYPYTSGQTKSTEQCRRDVGRNTFSGAQLRTVAGDEDDFANALSMGPLAATLNGENSHFYHYKSGIFDNRGCGTVVNHAVLIVGYGQEDGQEYWIIKNSWGPTWGEDGFMRLAKGYNRCGIASVGAIYLQ